MKQGNLKTSPVMFKRSGLNKMVYSNIVQVCRFQHCLPSKYAVSALQNFNSVNPTMVSLNGFKFG